MATRREEKEQLRKRRLAAEERQRQSERRRLFIFSGIGAAIVAPIMVGIVVMIVSSSGGGSPSAAHIDATSGSTNGASPDGREGTVPSPVRDPNLKSAAAKAGCELRLNLPERGRSHLPSGAPEPKYPESPPSSGNHSPVTQADGAYSDALSEQSVLHSLEHGRVAIQYQPDIAEAQQLGLKGAFDESPGGVLLFPNEQMPYTVAVTAWAKRLGCRSYEGAKTLDAVRDFREQFRGRGPESAPINPNA